MSTSRRKPTLVEGEDQQAPRKKIRKGTRSCWECKHRKVRCHLISDGDQICRECLARGTECHSQDLPEPENVRESERASTNDRLGRIESLLEKVLRRVDVVEDAEALILPSSDVEGDRSSSAETAATPANENAPILSLFNNEALGFQREDDSPRITTDQSTSVHCEKLRAKLLDLIPPERSLYKLETATGSWWLLRAQCFGECEHQLISNTSTTLSKSHPASIAKAVLWVVVALQQLPNTFEMDSLELPCHPSQLIAKSVNVVTQCINSDETLVSNVDGLECLVLQGIFYNNDGKLRSAWLSYRRALNVAQMIGFHRLSPDATIDSDLYRRGKHIWNHIIYADRYLSLMLGMYHGISDGALEFQGNSTGTPDSYPMDHLCRVAGSIVERNQRFLKVTPSMVRMTQEIDSELTSMNAPSVVEDSAIPFSGKSPGRLRCYNQLMTQLWYYQLVSWLHLPLLLESRVQGCYEYSRQRCLEASRSMITTYISIRRLTTSSFCCKSLDFQAFTAAVTLMINILGSGSQSDTYDHDSSAVEHVMVSLQKLAEGKTPDKVATRGLKVLRTLKNVAMGHQPTPSGHSEGDSIQSIQPNRIKFDIPYFGTICLDCNIRNGSAKQRPVTVPPHLSINADDQSINNTAMSNAGLLPERHAAQSQPIEMEPWLDTSFGLGSADLWTLDPEMTTLLPFFPNSSDSWDLGL